MQRRQSRGWPVRYAALLACALGGAACGFDLRLPPAPTGDAPVVDGFEPAAAFAGMRVTIRGQAFPERQDDLDVRFGASGAARIVSATVEEVVAIVPDDATDGAIAITSPDGRGLSDTAFGFLGLGRPRSGRIGAELAFPAELARIFPLGRGYLALDRDYYDRAVFKLGAPHPIAVERATDIGTWNGLALVLEKRGGAMSCALDLRFFDTEPNPPAEVTSIALDDEAGDFCPDFTTLVVGGDHALVVGHQGAWVVDLSTSPAETAYVPYPDEVSGADGAAWLGGERFAIGTLGGMVVLRRSAGTWDFLEEQWLFDDGLTGAMAAAPGVRLAVVSTEGELVVFDLAAEGSPETARTHVDLLATERPSLAVSPDGRHVALARTTGAAGRVATYDLGALTPAGIAPIAAAAVRRPLGVTATADGRFLVAGEGRITVLSQLSGQVIDEIAMPAGIDRPTLARFPDSPGVLAASVVARSFGRATWVVAETLRPAFAGLVKSGAGPVAALTGAPDADGAALLKSDRVERLTGMIGPAVADDAYTLDLADGLPDGATRSPDGRWVAVVQSIYADHAAVRLLPWDAAWTGLSPVRLGPFEARDVPEVHFAGDAVMVMEPRVARFYRLSAPQAGPFATVTDATDVVAAGGVQDLFVLVRQVNATDRPSLRLVSATDGTVREGDEFNVWDDALRGFAVSPSARALFWIDRRTEVPRLAWATLDPETASLGDAQMSVMLPAGARALVPLPDGERILVAEETGDRLLVIE